MARSEAVSVGACSAPAREARGGLTVTAPEARTIWAGRSVFAVCVRGASMDEDGLRDGDRLCIRIHFYAQRVIDTPPGTLARLAVNDLDCASRLLAAN